MPLLHLFTTTLLTLALSLPPTTTALIPIQFPTCPENLHIIVVAPLLATTTTHTDDDTNPPSTVLDPLVNATFAQLPSSNISTVAVPYYDPAAVRFTDPSTYVAAVDAGIRDLRAKINDSIAMCADGGGGAGIALLGYGRPGAQVVGDALCGRDGTTGQNGNFGEVAPLNRAWGEKITAVIMMGDPGHIGGQTAWNVGTAVRDGIYPYRDVEQCRWYDGRVQSYCDRGDPMCDSGENVAVHLGLVEKYLQNATDFVVKKASQAQPS